MRDTSDPFEVREVLRGAIYNDDGIPVAKARCELVYSKMKPRSLRALIDSIESIGTLSVHLIDTLKQIGGRENRILFKVESDDFKQKVELIRPSYTLKNNALEIESRPENYVITDRHWDYPQENDATINCQYTFHFPLPTILARKNWRLLHEHRGLMYGLDESDGSSSWSDEKVEFAIDDVKLMFYEAMSFQERSPVSTGFPEKLIASFGKAFVQVSVPVDKIEETHSRVHDLVEEFLRAISLLEGNRIEWHFEECYLSSTGRPIIEKIQRHRWSSPNKKSILGTKRGAEINDLRTAAIVLTQRVLSLTQSEQEAYREVVKCHVLASIADTIEMSYIYWHSCIDLIIKLTLGDTKPLSKKFITTCEQLNVPYSDLFPVPTRAEVFQRSSPKKFQFSEIRNEYIHNGLVINDYYEAIDQKRRMKAISERLLMARLGVNWHQVCMGNLEGL